jgi:hypothetical protein
MSITVRSNEPNPPTEAKAEQSVSAEVKDQVQETKPALDQESEQNATADSESSEPVENEEEKENEDHSDEPESGKSDENDLDKPKKKGGFQKRIDKLNQRITSKEQELEYWKQQALKTSQPQNQAPKVEMAPKADEGKPDPEKFETHAEYVEALTDWKTEQKFKERELKSEQNKIQSEQQNVIKSHQERLKSFSEKTKDFNDVLMEVDDIVVSPAVSQLLVTSENGPELMYELAKNRDEFEKLNKLPPLAAARELGRIESRISSKSTEKKVETKKITSAPKPIEPVGAGGKGSTPKSITDPNLSQAEYEALRREQIKRRRA